MAMKPFAVTSKDKYRTVGEGRIIEMFLRNGWAFELRGDARASAQCEATQALERLVAMGLQFRKTGAGERLFDPVEASNALRFAGIHFQEPTFREHCVPTARRLVWEAHGGGDATGIPPSPTELGPRRYAVTIHRTFNMAGFKPGDRVRLRLPLPLQDASLTDLRTEFVLGPGMESETRVAPARADVLVVVPVAEFLSVAVTATFTAWPNVPTACETDLDKAEAELYTRPKEGLVDISSRVEALAARIAADETDPYSLVRRFWMFLMTDLNCGSVHHDELDPRHKLDSLLDHGWYDCQAGSALMVALCRARGIPSRLVTGYFLHETSPSFHTWLEAWIPGIGWMPCDLIGWDLAPGDGNKDDDWRDYFFGRLDHRMAVERPPRLFGGTGSVRLPAAWHMLVTQQGPGCAVEFLDVETGRLVYRENIEVKRYR